MPDINSAPNIVPAPHPKHKSLVPILYMGLAVIAAAAVFAWAWLTK
jgi:hypothetical protein